MPYLQTKGGQPAKGITSMEFEHIMKKLKQHMEEPQMKQLLPRGERWLYSWDNDKVHQGAKLENMCMEQEERFELPELSSDMHKVVEHVHAWLQARMQQWLEDKDEEKLTVEQCTAELVRLFEQELQQESIKKDVKSLKATYKAVIERRGGYITAAAR
jgi:uncharacterized protein YydD (DUF2326 family)